ncbi:hypothetical protein Tco_1507785 [Tanacetum coccineum]
MGLGLSKSQQLRSQTESGMFPLYKEHLQQYHRFFRALSSVLPDRKRRLTSSVASIISRSLGSFVTIGVMIDSFPSSLNWLMTTVDESPEVDTSDLG